MPNIPPPDARRCTADKAKGGRCTGWTLRGRDVCVFHDPDELAKGQRIGASVVAEVHRERAQTRAAEQARIALQRIEDIPATLERIAEQVAAGAISHFVGGCLARLAQAAVQAHATIDELAERAHKRRAGMTDEQLAEALVRVRQAAQQTARESNGRLS